ncbi:unnamed protein product [Paramecium pentaurelia]|uniref:Short chain dehydrogenase n=1 Tax=Paramecium pentaurelia TaxID=43138 RepID=A0A8S1VY80_9CILI|nr:unnamed protein product [Paramecium pentaurelia]
MGNQQQILKLTKTKQFKPNSVIVITGASSGIGRELALQYATRGVKLMLAARSEEELKEVCTLCEQLGSRAHYQITDVSKEEDCKLLIEETVRIFNRIDILVLNAGVNAHSFFEEFKDLSVFKKIMDINFYGYVYCTKYALPHIRKSSGQFVVMSSISGEIGLPYRVPYCSSKFAVTGFFEALRTELEDFNVAITIVCPPSVRTPMRDHDLLKKHSPKDESEDRITIQECVSMILDAADRRARKIFFPFKAYLSVYVRPIFPDFVDKRLKQKAKL